MAHFRTLNENQPAGVSTFATFIDDLVGQFNNRFQDMRNQRENFKLFVSPFDVEVEKASAELQMELIELQCTCELSLQYKTNDILQFYKKHVMSHGTFPGLVQHAKKMCCIFGSTYLCESLFSKMKYTTSRSRSRLTDEHLEYHLKLSIYSLGVNIEDLSKVMQHQVAH